MRVILFSVITPGFFIVLQSLPHSVTLFHYFFSHFLVMKFMIRVYPFFLSLSSSPHTHILSHFCSRLISSHLHIMAPSCSHFPIFHPHFPAHFVASTVDHHHLILYSLCLFYSVISPVATLIAI